MPRHAPDRFGYELDDELSVSDVGFRAWGPDMEGVFVAAWRAVLDVLTGTTEFEGATERVELSRSASDAELLLYEFLEAQLYLKDAESKTADVERLRIAHTGDELELRAALRVRGIVTRAAGTDVKAVTWHRFSLRREGNTWRATVVLDV